MSAVQALHSLSAPAPRGPAALNWPSPDHGRVIESAADSQPEPGLVTLNDGGKLLGTVVRLDFDGAVLEFLPQAGPPRLLPFASFRSLYLARTIELERIPLAVPPGGVEARPSSVKRKCTIDFKDGSTLQADVVSVVRRKPGLFLFVTDYADKILRWFLPAEAVANHRLGEPLGKALREHKLLAQEALDAALEAQQRLQAARIGDYLSGQGIVTREQLEAALVRQSTMSRLRVGDTLVQEKLVTAAQRDAALVMQAGDRRRLLGEILVAAGAVTREDIRRVLVEQIGMPSVNLARFQYDPNAVKALSSDLARRYQVMPLYRTGTRIAVAIENPLSWEALQSIEFFTGLKVDPAMAAREDLLAAIAQFYGGAADGDQVAEIVARLDVESRSAEPTGEALVTESDSTLVRLVNKIIIDAYDRGASDIHIESMSDEKPSRVRFRVDGVLEPYIEIPPNFRAALVSRLKIMSVLDISERRRPQDGKIRFEAFGPRKLELRVVTMPTTYGLEDVVMRLLAAPRALTLGQLALRARVLRDLEAMADRSFGLMLVCGPTGSGKTTTLHSVLNHLNTPQRKIWTIEDPIEISQEGLCQVQVNEKLGLSFAEALRSFMRADPDVIMVGEIRDLKTAGTVITASLTGHLVLSTMHTNSAVESVIRLLDFGLDPFSFSDALLGILGQRIVRRLCTACRTSYVAAPEEIEALAHEYCRDLPLVPEEMAARWRVLYGSSDGALTLHAPAGCPLCDRSGYKGRMGVQELLVATPAIKAMILAKANSADILREAIGGGMVTIKQDAIEKILQGHLDFRQVKADCL
jgi:type II secretory ATPase GspE/PulE/Tfp pilus assembly ATPase PilB-like protein